MNKVIHRNKKMANKMAIKQNNSMPILTYAVTCYTLSKVCPWHIANVIMFLNSLNVFRCAEGNVTVRLQALTIGKQTVCCVSQSWWNFTFMTKSFFSLGRRGLCPCPVSHCMIRPTVKLSGAILLLLGPSCS